MTENKEIQRPEPSRKDRKLQEQVSNIWEELEIKYLEARALYGEGEQTARVLEICDIKWKRYVIKFNKKYGKQLKADAFIESLNSSYEMEKAMLNSYKNTIQAHKFDRWLNIQKEYNWWSWLYNILDWLTFNLSKKSYWKKRYEKVQARSSRRA